MAMPQFSVMVKKLIHKLILMGFCIIVIQCEGISQDSGNMRSLEAGFIIPGISYSRLYDVRNSSSNLGVNAVLATSRPITSYMSFRYGFGIEYTYIRSEMKNERYAGDSQLLTYERNGVHERWQLKVIAPLVLEIPIWNRVVRLNMGVCPRLALYNKTIHNWNSTEYWRMINDDQYMPLVPPIRNQFSGDVLVPAISIQYILRIDLRISNSEKKLLYGFAGWEDSIGEESSPLATHVRYITIGLSYVLN